MPKNASDTGRNFAYSKCRIHLRKALSLRPHHRRNWQCFIRMPRDASLLPLASSINDRLIVPVVAPTERIVPVRTTDCHFLAEIGSAWSPVTASVAHRPVC